MERLSTHSTTPVITLDGSGAGSNASGLELTAAGDVVKALDIVNFNFAGILIDNGGTTATVQACYLGLTTAGTVASNFDGVAIFDSSSNTIGGTSGVTTRNVISGNSNANVVIFADPGQTASSNVVEGNCHRYERGRLCGTGPRDVGRRADSGR